MFVSAGSGRLEYCAQAWLGFERRKEALCKKYAYILSVQPREQHSGMLKRI
jgi:hypothetical protein